MGSSSQIDRYEVHYVSRSYNNNQKPDRGNRGNHAKAPSRLLRKKRLRLPHQQARTGRTLAQRRRKRRKRGSRPLPDRLPTSNQNPTKPRTSEKATPSALQTSPSLCIPGRHSPCTRQGNSPSSSGASETRTPTKAHGKSSTSPLLHLPPRQHRASSLKFHPASTTCAT